MALTLFLVSAYLPAVAQNPAQQALIVKKTATWCSNCGSWGWTWFKDLIQATDGQGGIPIALHSTSSQLKPPADLDGALLSAFNTSGGFPAFFVNGVQYATYAATLSAAQAAISQQPVATIDLETGYEADSIHTRATLTWTNEGEGQYAVGFYVVEDSVIFQQSGQGSGAIHRYVLRNVLGGQPFGQPESIMYASGQSTMHELADAYPGIGVARHHILAVLWKQVGGKYQYVNAAMVRLEEGGITSATEEQLALGTLSVFPNPVLPGGGLSVTADLGVGPLTWRLLGLQGGTLASGHAETSSWEVGIPTPLVSGMVFLEVSGPSGTVTRKVQVR